MTTDLVTDCFDARRVPAELSTLARRPVSYWIDNKPVASGAKMEAYLETKTLLVSGIGLAS